MNLGIGLDRYDRNARLKPALLTVLPVAWTVLAWAPGHELGWGAFWSLFLTTGGTFLIVQLARDRGKALEKGLYEIWGGRPSERVLSYAGSNNQLLLSRRHERLRQLVSNVTLPINAADEAALPLTANDAYETCTAWLISQTRDQQKFPLGLDPVWWTSFLWGIRCPDRWQTYPSGDHAGDLMTTSRPRRFAWCSTRARAWAASPAISI